MYFDRNDVVIEKFQRDDLKYLEKVFTGEFGTELDIEVIKQRIGRVRQFYHFLLPLSHLSDWVNNLFNIYVIRVRGRLAGFVQFSSINRQQLHLDFIAVSSQYRGHGLATYVLTKLFTKLADKQDRDVILEVRVENPAAELYHRLGFSGEARLLRFERPLEIYEVPPETIVGLRSIMVQDRSKLYSLYRASVSNRLRRIVRRQYKDFNPSVFVRQLTWLKDYLMNNNIVEYVVERDGKIVAYIELRSYVKAESHTISMLLHTAYEHLRELLLKNAVQMLAEEYETGSISTTIYDDDSRKMLALEGAGFQMTEAYYLMLRSPVNEYSKSVHKVHRPVAGKGIAVRKITSPRPKLRAK